MFITRLNEKDRKEKFLTKRKGWGNAAHFISTFR